MDEIIVFHALSDAEIVQIARLMLEAIITRMQERGISLSFEDDAVALLAKHGFDPQYGARPLRRAIQRMVEDALSEQIVSGALMEGDKVRMFARDGKLDFIVDKAEGQDKETVTAEPLAT